MSQDRLESFPPASGEEFRPARGKLVAMLVVFALMVPAGAVAAYCWWFEVQLPNGKFLSSKAGIVGLLAIPVGALLAVVALALLASAKRLIIADDCVQLLSRGNVVVHIPFANVAETYASGEGAAGVVGLKLRDRQDPATLVPFWTKDRYEIQVLVYGKTVEYLHGRVKEGLAAFRAGGR